MVTITALWLPILLSAVLVFIASSVIHMLLPIHKGEYGRIPGEEEVLEAMRKGGVGRGAYMFPYAGSMQAMQTPEMHAKLERGPVGFMYVLPPGPINMGGALGRWFLYLLVVGVMAAYVAGRTLAPGTEYLAVFRVTGTAAFLCYALGRPQNAIWGGEPWSMTLKHMFDGLVYSLLTAGAFGWLWPR